MFFKVSLNFNFWWYNFDGCYLCYTRHKTKILGILFLNNIQVCKGAQRPKGLQAAALGEKNTSFPSGEKKLQAQLNLSVMNGHCLNCSHSV